MPIPGSPQERCLASEADIVFFGGAAGGGKGLSVDEVLPTPTGFRRMGDVHVGDVLFDKDGQACSVIAVTDTQYRRCFELEFDDGTTIIADDVHRWLTFSADELHELTRLNQAWRERRRQKRASHVTGNKSAKFTESLIARNRARIHAMRDPPTGTIRDTAEIFYGQRLPSGRANYAIPTAAPIALPDASLSIDPYTLGLWLGDGYSRAGMIGMCQKDMAELRSLIPYQVTWEKIESEPRYKTPFHIIRSPMLHFLLRKCSLLKNKHIPMEFKRASIEQRKELLRGLLDTDGTVGDGGQVSVGFSNRRLAEDTLELVNSLGIKANLSTHKTIGADHHSMKFVCPFPAFRLKRKAERQKVDGFRRTGNFRYITNVREILTFPTRCIAVDSPSRTYLAGRAMIPTHNTDLLVGVPLTQHQVSIIFRRQEPQLEGIQQRLTNIVARRGRWNGKWKRWVLDDGRIIELGGVDKPDSVKKFQGRPHDFIGFDEITHFTLAQFRFLTGWNRPARPEDANRRCRVICAGNPPTDAEGDWVVEYWGPWLDPKHPNPAKEGELRWYATIGDKDIARPDGAPFEWTDERTGKTELIKPRSRTFIRSLVTDNPYMMAAGYMSVLQAMPEPLRSQMLYGDFQIGQKDVPEQVIPSSWVIAAQKRWRPDGNIDAETRERAALVALGVDVARGGEDFSVITPLYENGWFGEQVIERGSLTRDGLEIARMIQGIIPAGEAPEVKIDVIGVGSSPFDMARALGMNAHPMNSQASSRARDKARTLRFMNMRAQWWWQLREALDPNVPEAEQLAIPPDRQILADLTAPRFTMRLNGIQVESKDDIQKRIGRSPDRGESLVYAFGEPKRALPLRPGGTSLAAAPVSIFQR